MPSALSVGLDGGLATARDWSDFGECLKLMHRRTGMSLKQVETAARGAAGPGVRQGRELPTSTVSDVINGKRRASKDILIGLLTVWKVTQAEHDAAMDAWRRINSQVGRGPVGAGRFYEASPRELGVSVAINVGAASSDLTPYVTRYFDQQLRQLLGTAADAGRGCFTVLVGESSAGKTRSLYEAVNSQIPDWWLVQPADTREIHDLANAPVGSTILWLDELHRYLGAEPPLTRETINSLSRAGIIVVGTIWPDQFALRWTMRRTDGTDEFAEDRRLLDLCESINVPRELTPGEHQEAARLGAQDTRIDAALRITDAEFVQALAGAPALQDRWEQAPDAYTRAIITAAADARRIGVHSPLPREVLKDAMVGYLTPKQQVTAPDEWIEPALRYATQLLKGAVSALVPVAGSRPGTLGGFVVADYLAQHISRSRRTICPPGSLWDALTDHLGSTDDLRRVAEAATARMRYDHAERALMRLADTGPAAVELAVMLRRQGRSDQAVALLDRRLKAAPDDEACRAERTRTIAIRERALEILHEAQEHPRAHWWHDELLADGGKADDLRQRTGRGDLTAADEFADLLAARGCLEELRELADAGHQYACERLAEFLVSQGRRDELEQRVEAGDRAALLYRNRLGTSGSAGEDVAAVSERMSTDPVQSPNGSRSQEADGEHDESAAVQKVAYLFDSRDIGGLRKEVDAGTPRAAELFVALLTAEQATQPAVISRLRAFGMNAVDLEHPDRVRR
ncbi:tetratricopeptide repeat protein [Catellatospora citrea]|uniref:Tetratricopeptide repeat protein n=1 Tax=Catellatospora citrea TaxID=53366 RepID=A0A8J3KM12_9ACTN|nr:hypothetical protein [Catellatospora citrea]RKE10713.1 hypothetical protein C8E86_5630 [Catellatospora citrea]GIG01154.1 hypothetical protein Cci01nite_62470 [Catellatospora citrea]